VGALRGESVNELVAERAPHRNETISLIAQFEARHLESPIDMPWFDVQSAPFRMYLQSLPGHDINHTQEFMAIAGTQATR
jgi:hypothetical protein